MRWLFALMLATAAGGAGAASSLALSPARITRLDSLPAGASIVLDRFPDGFGGSDSLRFERIDIYARGARLLATTADGEREIPRSRRRELVGANAAGDIRAVLAFDPGFRNVAGGGTTALGAFVVAVQRDRNGVRLLAMPAAQALPAGVTPDIIAGDDALAGGRALPGPLATAPGASVLHGVPRGATVAVDTDNELMSLRFGNDTGAAADWIADLFGAMNVMYLRDLDVMLLQGTTYLRTTTDPYTQTGTPANQADLTEFGDYWQDHYANVPRSFALLLSGKAQDGNHASGIAWLDAYCRTQSQGGSYSVNQVFTNAQIGVAYSTLIVGHELGHNFGAYHTHCTNVSTGGAPTGSGTIDKCYSGEPDCYSGATSCPTSGPGAPAGTVMSYCNSIQCGPTGQNVLQFHPTQVGVLSTLIAQNTPSCLSAYTDLIFGDGFE